MDFTPLLSPIILTLALALCVTVILVVIATPIAWWLARGKGGGRDVMGAVVTLPLVLPPTVLGFYLLLALGPNGPGGALASLAYSLVLIALFTLPAIMEGSSPLAVAVVTAAAIMLVSLYLSHGFDVRTTVAMLGTLVSLVVIGVLRGGSWGFR